MRPEALEARQHLLQRGELDLEHGLTCLRAGDEDIEDDLLAVDGAQLGVLLPVALLRGRELVVEDDQAAFLVAGQLGDLLELAGADERARVLLAELGDDLAADLDADVADELMELIEQHLGFLGGVFRTLQADQDRTVGAGDDLGVERVERLVLFVFGFVGHVAEIKRGRAL